MPRRYTESCLSVYIYKPKTQAKALDITQAGMRESLVLNTVTSVALDSEIVYDEGDTRAIRKDTILTLEALITQNKNSEFSDSWEYGNERPGESDRIQPPLGNQPLPSNEVRGGNFINNRNIDTAALQTFLTDYLSTQGLVVDLAHYPAAITSIIPSTSLTASPSTFTPQRTAGLLVDSYNGPKPISIQFIPLAGGNDFKLVWKVKFSTSLQSTENYGNALQAWNDVDVSSELRLDIDNEGDLEIIVAGTIYAPNPRALYAARDQLHILTAPMSRQFKGTTLQEIAPQTVEVDDLEKYQDLFAQVNGFEKKVTFNVEKSGRSAKFSITYSQIKSNSAYPLGIRDIDFEHEISSSLFGENVMEGSGFTSWKSVFSGKMKIPHRFNANYAWFVIFHLIAEKTRKLKKFSKGASVSEAAAEMRKIFNEKSYGGMNTNETLSKITGIPTFIRLKHRHFKREVEFTIEYLVVCPLQHVFEATCLFERVNNDYYTRMLNANPDGTLPTNYRPKKLSQQWMDWMVSVNPDYGFDPTSMDADNPFAGRKEFRDNAGTEIVDGGHEINPFLPGTGRNRRQIHSFVTRTIDPNETDPDYYPEYPGDTIDSIKTFFNVPKPAKIQSLAGIGFFGTTESNMISGDPYQQPMGGTNLNSDYAVRYDETLDPRFTWVKYNETYTVHTTHPTIPTEGLSSVDSSWHSEKKLYREYINGATDEELASNPDTVKPPVVPSLVPDPSAATSVAQASGMHAGGSTGHPEEEGSIQRKTYALKGSRYYVTVRGHAVRVKYPIACPTVISIAGKPAIKVGEGRFMVSPQGTSGDNPVYVAAWEQTYTVDKSLDGVDLLSAIESTGASVFYT